MRRSRAIIALVAACAGLAAFAAVTDAADTFSSNWAGYAVHATHVRFSSVKGSWREPAGACRRASKGYAAFWVGLGGFRRGSRALEQVGTQLRCTAAGRARYTALYELVPARVRRIDIRVAARDLISARVTITAREVTVVLTDRTSGRSYSRTIPDRHPDGSSAEWIAEAPSSCLTITRCRALPLANFGRIGFSAAEVSTSTGLSGGILSSFWRATRIVLGVRAQSARGGRRGRSGHSASGARPSRLDAHGDAFWVQFLASGS